MNEREELLRLITANPEICEPLQLFCKLSPEEKRAYLSRLRNLVNDKEDMHDADK